MAGHALFFELTEFFWLPSNLYLGFARAQKRDPQGKVGGGKPLAVKSFGPGLFAVGRDLSICC